MPSLRARFLEDSILDVCVNLSQGPMQEEDAKLLF